MVTEQLQAPDSIDSVQTLMLIYDTTSTQLHHIHQQTPDLLGYTSATYPNRNYPLAHLIIPEDRAKWDMAVKQFQTLPDNKDYSFSCRLQTIQGSIISLAFNGQIISRSKITHEPATVLLVAHDTSLKTQAIAELAIIRQLILEKEELMQDYKEQVDVKETFLECGSWKWAPAENLLTWSDGMYRLFGYDPDIVRNRLTIDPDLYRKHLTDDSYEHERRFHAEMTKDKETYHREFEIITQTGETKFIQSFARIVRNTRGDIMHILGTSRNITRDRNSQKELEQNIQLLKGSVSNLEEFTYIASHDIQEPLRRIASFSERMKERFSGEMNVEANEYLDRIINSSRNAHQLIDGLRTFLQLDQQHIPVRKTDLNQLLEEVKQELELSLEETRARIHIESLPVIEAVPMEIKQLFINLLTNAMKFRSKEVPLLIEISGRLIPAPADSAGNFCEITVSDNGVGFEDGAIQKMFQMFQRFHPKSEYPGAGIGLAICKKIISRHHGQITAKSNPGQGATFSIVLPVRQHSQ